MDYPFYNNTGVRPPDGAPPTELPTSAQRRMEDPAKYKADVGLKDACNVALLLGQPLLLTGEPGTGKTVFANNLAYELGLPKPLMFETKSNSIAQDLFYTYDVLKRFQRRQSEDHDGDDSALPYITYRALGKAILLTINPQEAKPYLPPGFEHPGKIRSVVLIDEIDKAPRDFPNDMLNELERMRFRVPELGEVEIRADRELQPVVVITSNSEKDLPDAFLRRCVYYNIPFPDAQRLREIVVERLGLHAAGSSAFLDDALEVFHSLRDPYINLRKRPATAELLGWLLAMQRLAPGVDNPLEDPGLALHTISNLVKTAEDQLRASEVVEQWVNNRQPAG